MGVNGNQLTTHYSLLTYHSLFRRPGQQGQGDLHAGAAHFVQHGHDFAVHRALIAADDDQRLGIPLEWNQSCCHSHCHSYDPHLSRYISLSFNCTTNLLRSRKIITAKAKEIISTKGFESDSFSNDQPFLSKPFYVFE